MQDVMVGDKSSNTLCIGRAIHTPTTPGLITRTYTPPKHCQTFTFLTPLRLDGQQYKEALEIPKRILIPSSLWLFNTSKHHCRSTVHFVSTIQTHSTLFTTSLTVQRCPTPLPPSLSRPTRLLPSTVLATPPTSSRLPLPTALQIQKWRFLMNR